MSIAVCDALSKPLVTTISLMLGAELSRVLPPAPLEKLEKLEQLRVLALGRGLQVGVVRQASVGVDTPEDYERFVQMCRQRAA